MEIMEFDWIVAEFEHKKKCDCKKWDVIENGKYNKYIFYRKC